MQILVAGGIIVNEGRQEKGSLVIKDCRIEDVFFGEVPAVGDFDRVIDATGCYVLPGVIDSHVHFREPGMTHKADISSESRAAAYGGVTSFFEMPNTLPPTISQQTLDDKFLLAKQESHVNYSFFPGASNDNAPFLLSLDVSRVPGIKLFMGSSTGNLLVDEEKGLRQIFQIAHDRGLILMAHLEAPDIINRNMEHFKTLLSTDDPDISYHPLIRSEEACYTSSQRGVSLAKEYKTHLHIAHLSTAKELGLLGGNITGEVCLSYLLFDDSDYAHLGAKIKCNPAIKTAKDREALLLAVREGLITTISTDHAPHLLSEKEGGAARAMSGMPMLQFSLPAMLTLAESENIPLTRVVELMSHNPARLFSVAERGFLNKGYRADVTIVKPERWVVTRDVIQSKCGWSPLEGRELTWVVSHTICNGHIVYDNGAFDEEYRGDEIKFHRERK